MIGKFVQAERGDRWSSYLERSSLGRAVALNRGPATLVAHGLVASLGRAGALRFPAMVRAPAADLDCGLTWVVEGSKSKRENLVATIRSTAAAAVRSADFPMASSGPC
jgi:hypothetical protein